MEGEREMEHTLHKRGLWLLTLLVTLVFALEVAPQAGTVPDGPEEPETCDRHAFSNRDDKAGDIYEQQYEGRSVRKKSGKGTGHG